ncbi:methylated-DNA--[protein]-cysteine S-methyltransferase [Corynebacterium sp. MSK044]|uniref:methylated-DNA--[protein]-cysteine S-methyltransferase n=1 Tax=Corynebacterium sp. MSK044 TaxID=3050195 RepID=UPI00254DCA79|nr:methylated-DNA--[protein]-cysteine S-methyltransferase [Corynebacterium sp. MSK044]MDK8798185.1 methylated-DNA--[protein]-cysteine S-methyltransferase [Corynebacterium sp. MSK044]
MDDLRFHEMPSPIGRLGVVTSSDDVVKVLFESDEIDDERGRISAANDVPPAVRELAEYFSGQRRDFTVPLDFRFVSGFRADVLRELVRVPFGETTTYGELARKVGNPKAVRAVGSACANNPLPLLVPCHRVLRADGTLGGYRGGLEAKCLLLELEGIDEAGVH